MSTMMSRESPAWSNPRLRQSLLIASRVPKLLGFSYRRNVISANGASFATVCFGIAYNWLSEFKRFQVLSLE